MSNKMLIGVVVAILVFVIILISVVANSFKNDGTKYEAKTPGMITKKEEEKAEKSYAKSIDNADKIQSKYKSNSYTERYVSLSEEDRHYMDDLIDRVLGWINNYDLDELFENHFSEFYKKAKFPTKESLTQFVQETFPNDSTYTINFYEINGDSLFLPIVKITEKGNELIDIKVTGYQDENFVIYFDNVQDVLRLMNTYNTDKFSIKIIYGIDAQDYCSFFLIIENISNQDETLDFTGTVLTEKVGKAYQNISLLSDDKVFVPKGQKVVHELKFKKYRLYPTGMVFKISCGGKNYNYDMFLNYDSLDNDR